VFTLDGFRLPLTPGLRVYLEITESHWQSERTYHEPPVLTTKRIPGKVLLDGMTAAFDTSEGVLIKHLRQCSYCEHIIRLPN
jgi:hypothetical protein